KIKVCNPNTFDGTNPKKLRDFLVSCNLHFHNCPHVFSSDEKMIILILSYLKGSALSWFEPGLNDPTDSAHWILVLMTQQILHTGCGTTKLHNPVGDVEKALSDLAMKKGGQITKYNVYFWELASRVNWNEAALHNRYFCGLPL
ncbi:hypothetical protein L208DRAFT_1246105, partial [Tricholoma matsutake]